jgi:hypothetical protein
MFLFNSLLTPNAELVLTVALTALLNVRHLSLS